MTESKQWDVFISYASEDIDFVRPLANYLGGRGLRVWYDEFELKVGDSLSASINHGLANSKFGVVILSRNFFRKWWPGEELSGLISLSEGGRNRVLPVWYDITAEEVKRNSPILAGKVAVLASRGLEHVADRLIRAIYHDANEAEWAPHEIPWPDGTTMVVLPLGPLRGKVLCMGKHPVINEQYRKFIEYSDIPEPVGENWVREGGVDRRGQWEGPFYPWREAEFRDPDKPVVCVSHSDAEGYCWWVNDQSRQSRTMLPTSALWAFAAFGTENPRWEPLSWLATTGAVHYNSSSPAPVDREGTRINVRGVSDMFGNVWEWCRDSHPRAFALGPREPDVIGVQGGGYLDDLAKPDPPRLDSRQLADRDDTRHSDLGFRIMGIIEVSDLPEDVRVRLFNRQPAASLLHSSFWR